MNNISSTLHRAQNLHAKGQLKSAINLYSKIILFDALTFHRRSCTILQRTPEIDRFITDQVHKPLVLTGLNYHCI